MGKLYKRKNSPYYWYSIYHKGKLIRESSKVTSKRDAMKVLNARQASLLVNHYLPEVKDYQLTKYSDLRELILNDYIKYDRKSIYSLKLKLKPLDAFFEGYRASDIEKHVDNYIKERKGVVKNSTLNRELSILIRMFSLGVEKKIVKDVLKIKKLDEDNIRTGYLEHEEYLYIYKILPNYIKPIVHLGYKSGMRKSEILGLKWKDVDMRNWIINLENTKSNEKRIYPLDEELQREFRELFQRKNENIPYVFLNREGDGRVKDFYFVWRQAVSEAAKFHGRLHLKDILFHDLRRTAVRNMVRAGIPRKICMMLSGHKTESIFERYHIVNPNDLEEAVRVQGEFIREQYQKFLDRLWST
jgi:integrase